MDSVHRNLRSQLGEYESREIELKNRMVQMENAMRKALILLDEAVILTGRWKEVESDLSSGDENRVLKRRAETARLHELFRSGQSEARAYLRE